MRGKKMKKLLSISENSTLPELLSEIRFSFEEKESEEIQRILMRREEDLNTEIRNLRRDFDLLKEKHDLVRDKYCLSELQKLELEAELKKCRDECDLLEEKNCFSVLEKLDLEAELKKCRDECDLLEEKNCFSVLEKLDLDDKFKKHKSEHDLLEKKHCFSELDKLELRSEYDSLEKKPSSSELKKKRKLETCEKDTEESNGVEIEYKRKITELTRENEKMKEEIELYSKTFSEYQSRISGIDEVLAGLLETNASNSREENNGGHSPDITSMRIQPSRDLTENSHLQKEGNMDNMSIPGNVHNSPAALSNPNLHESEKDGSDVMRVIIESVTAGSGTGTMHMGSTGSRENMSIAGRSNVHNSPEALSNSNLHESQKDASDVERWIIESVTAVPAALFPESASPIDVEQTLSPSTAAAVVRSGPQIITISSGSDSDTDSITDSVTIDAYVKNIRMEEGYC